VLGRGGVAGQGRLATLLGARNEAWTATADLIGDRPLLGYGFGSGDRVFARYPDRASFRFFQGANPNNGYLQAVLELGLVLSLVILLPLLGALATGVRSAFQRAYSAERAALLACLVAGLVAGIFESLFTAAGAPWAMLIWLSAAALLYERATPRADVGGRAAASAQYHRQS
jgi:O-antigen ligase